MNKFRELAGEILNEDVQEEGILDRLSVRAKTLGSRIGASAAKLTTSDQGKKNEYDGNFVMEVLKSYDKIYNKKLQKLNKSSFEDITILLKRQSEKSGSIQEWDKVTQTLSDPKNLEILNDRIKDVHSDYILEVYSALGLGSTPPPLPDQTVNQSTGDGGSGGTNAGTRGGRAFSS